MSGGSNAREGLDVQLLYTVTISSTKFRQQIFVNDLSRLTVMLDFKGTVFFTDVTSFFLGVKNCPNLRSHLLFWLLSSVLCIGAVLVIKFLDFSEWAVCCEGN